MQYIYIYIYTYICIYIYGYHSKIFWVSLCIHFSGNYFVYFCIYSEWQLFMSIYVYLCDYLCLFFKKMCKIVGIYFCFVLVDLIHDYKNVYSHDNVYLSFFEMDFMRIDTF